MSAVGRVGRFDRTADEEMTCRGVSSLEVHAPALVDLEFVGRGRNGAMTGVMGVVRTEMVGPGGGCCGGW